MDALDRVKPRPGGPKQDAEGRRGVLPGLEAKFLAKRRMSAYKEGDMGKLVQFIKESYAELRKVIWPGRDDVVSSVKVVILSTIIIAAVLGLVDVLLLLGVQVIF
jgi:preprotein translocase subunit SecE